MFLLELAITLLHLFVIYDFIYHMSFVKVILHDKYLILGVVRMKQISKKTHAIKQHCKTCYSIFFADVAKYIFHNYLQVV